MRKRVIEWFRMFFGTPSSSSVAKDRLRLVLLSDHLALAPDVIESMRREIFEVISRYVEVDEAHSDVSFEHKDEGIAMLANIPIISLKPREDSSPKEETSVLETVSVNGHNTDNYGPRPRKRRRRKASGASQTAPAQ